MGRNVRPANVHDASMEEITTMSKKKSTTAKQSAIEKPVAEPKSPHEKKSGAKTRAAVWEKVGEPTPEEPTPVVPKTAESKTAKKSTARTPEKPKRTADEVMPKAKASEELVVFAFRLTEAEREAIHDAAGPARASRFVRAVALAAARHDVAALQNILLEAAKGASAS